MDTRQILFIRYLGGEILQFFNSSSNIISILVVNKDNPSLYILQISIPHLSWVLVQEFISAISICDLFCWIFFLLPHPPPPSLSSSTHYAYFERALKNTHTHIKIRRQKNKHAVQLTSIQHHLHSSLYIMFDVRYVMASS